MRDVQAGMSPNVWILCRPVGPPGEVVKMILESNPWNGTNTSGNSLSILSWNEPHDTGVGIDAVGFLPMFPLFRKCECLPSNDLEHANHLTVEAGFDVQSSCFGCKSNSDRTRLTKVWQGSISKGQLSSTLSILNLDS